MEVCRGIWDIRSTGDKVTYTNRVWTRFAAAAARLLPLRPIGTRQGTHCRRSDRELEHGLVRLLTVRGLSMERFFSYPQRYCARRVLRESTPLDRTNNVFICDAT